MNEDKTEFLIEWLEGIAEGTVKWPREEYFNTWDNGYHTRPSAGLCHAIREVTHCVEQLVPYWWVREFDHFSGEPSYPLPGGYKGYIDHVHCPLVGEYGEYRRLFAQHCADYFKHWRRR